MRRKCLSAPLLLLSLILLFVAKRLPFALIYIFIIHLLIQLVIIELFSKSNRGSATAPFKEHDGLSCLMHSYERLISYLIIQLQKVEYKYPAILYGYLDNCYSVVLKKNLFN